MSKINLEIYNGKSKKTGKDFECLKLSIGEWNTLLFATRFEMDYIKKILDEQK